MIMEPNTSCLALMNDVVAEALESMAFLEVLPTTTSISSGENAMWVSLLIHDPVQGELQLVMEKELVHYIMDIVYGSMQGAKPVSEKEQYDLLAEILNTVTGRFLSVCLPNDQCFQLGLPEIGHGGHAWPEPPIRCWHYQVEGMHFSMAASGESLLGLLAEPRQNDPQDG